MPKAKAYQLRTSSLAELEAKIQAYKEELHTLRVGFVPKTHEARVGKMQLARKNIQRCLTIYNEKRRDEAKAQWANKKWIPKKMRPRMTRAMRRRLTPEQASLAIKHVRQKHANFPKRTFVVLAEL